MHLTSIHDMYEVAGKLGMGGDGLSPSPPIPSFPRHFVHIMDNGIYSCGNVACRMGRERSSNTVIRSRPLHTMPTVGKMPRCSRLSPSAEEPMLRTLYNMR